MTHLRAAPGDAEYFDATMHAPTLKRVADETGGRFYTPATMQGLTEDLKYTGRGVTTVEERDSVASADRVRRCWSACCARSGVIGVRWGWRKRAASSGAAGSDGHGWWPRSAMPALGRNSLAVVVQPPAR